MHEVTSNVLVMIVKEKRAGMTQNSTEQKNWQVLMYQLKKNLKEICISEKKVWIYELLHSNILPSSALITVSIA